VIRRAAAIAALAFVAATAHARDIRIEPQDSGTNVRLRGISAVDSNVAWASGREGTVLRTVDGGAHWASVSVPDAKALDFRDIEAFDANTAVVLGIGPGAASRVYRTQDGGKTWSLTLQNADERAFFDCMVFEGDKGWMLGDPVDGTYQIRTTQDGGRAWTLQATGPAALKDEAAFAASGTCIARTPWGETLAVSGGAGARVHLGDSGGALWFPHATPMPHRIPAAGIFSATPMGEDMLLVGGDFERPTVGSAARVQFVSGHGLSVTPMPSPRGYRSGAACILGAPPRCIAVGPDGVDLWNGRHWSAVSDTGYDAIDLAAGTGWATGDGGRIARITWSAAPSSTPPPAPAPSRWKPAPQPSKP
jgi:hypothetical protein